MVFCQFSKLYLNLDPPRVDAGEAGEAARHVGEVVLVLEDVLSLGPDPVHLGPVGQVRLVTHQEGQRQQGGDGCRLLSPGNKLLSLSSIYCFSHLANPANIAEPART